MLIAAPESERMMTYEDALLYCAFCNHGGYRDWRMPTYSEWLALGLYGGWWLDRVGGVYAPRGRLVVPVRNR